MDSQLPYQYPTSSERLVHSVSPTPSNGHNVSMPGYSGPRRHSDGSPTRTVVATPQRSPSGSPDRRSPHQTVTRIPISTPPAGFIPTGYDYLYRCFRGYPIKDFLNIPLLQHYRQGICSYDQIRWIIPTSARRYMVLTNSDLDARRQHVLQVYNDTYPCEIGRLGPSRILDPSEYYSFGVIADQLDHALLGYETQVNEEENGLSLHPNAYATLYASLVALKSKWENRVQAANYKQLILPRWV